MLVDHPPLGWARGKEDLGCAGPFRAEVMGILMGTGRRRGVGQRGTVLEEAPNLPSAPSAACPVASPWLHSTLLAQLPAPSWQPSQCCSGPLHLP